MEQKIVKHLENSAKTIKVSGQNKGFFDGKDCMYDCHIQEKEWIGRRWVPFTVCYEDVYRIISDYYNASWSESF